MESAIVISINGQKAVDAAKAFCAGSCTRGIYSHGKRIAAVEVVVDQDGTYNGNPNKWVDVTVTVPGKEEAVINQLTRLGFASCPCIISVETYTGCFANAQALCCMII